MSPTDEIKRTREARDLLNEFGARCIVLYKGTNEKGAEEMRRIIKKVAQEL